MRRLINVLKQWLSKPFKSTKPHELTEYEKWCPVCDGAGYMDILPCDTCDGKGYVRMTFKEKHDLSEPGPSQSSDGPIY